jgi:hypothetical protein
VASGTIRNIARRAAFMAAARGEPVMMADLRVSAWQEACGPGHQPGDDADTTSRSSQRADHDYEPAA